MKLFSLNNRAQASTASASYSVPLFSTISASAAPIPSAGRYGRWLATKRRWRVPDERKEGEAVIERAVELPQATPTSAALADPTPPTAGPSGEGVIVIDETDTGAIDEVLADLARE